MVTAVPAYTGGNMRLTESGKKCLLTGAAFGGTKLSISFLVMRPSGPDPEQETAQLRGFYHFMDQLYFTRNH